MQQRKPGDELSETPKGVSKMLYLFKGLGKCSGNLVQEAETSWASSTSTRARKSWRLPRLTEKDLGSSEWSGSGAVACAPPPPHSPPPAEAKGEISYAPLSMFSGS